LTAYPVPEELRGLWRREVMIAPDGTRDTTTEVFWLQSESLFADLRVPADRPGGGNGFSHYSDRELAQLARMSGFGGVLEVEGGVCRWRHELDYQPPGGAADEARYTLDGDILVETGIHANYEEVWRRETPLGARFAAFRLAEDAERPGREGIFVVVGDYFLVIESRPSVLPEGASLTVLVEGDLAAGSRDLAMSRLDMRIAHGCAGGGWPVLRSTFPWLEGVGLFEGRTAKLEVGGQYLAVGRQGWRLAESNMGAATLAACFS